MTETNTMYYEIQMQTRDTIRDLTLLDDDGYSWRFRYYGVDYLLMYMPSANMTYIHTAYRDRDARQWLPGEVVGYFHGMPHEYDFTQELHIDWAARYRGRIVELNTMVNNYKVLIDDMLCFIECCCVVTLDCYCCDPIDCKYLRGNDEHAECTRYQDFLSRAKAIAVR